MHREIVDQKGAGMTDEVLEQVRQRYAAAATAVTATGRGALAVVDAAGCCTPTTSPEANISCCGAGDVDAAFGSTLYSAGEQGELPAEAVAASQPGLRQPDGQWPSCARVRRCSTSAQAAGLTCCSRRGGSGRPATPTAST